MTLKIPRAVFLAGFLISAPAAEVTFPDPGLNAAVREALHKPFEPLTDQDLLGLTGLNASRRNISSLAGLEAAQHLITLNLASNRLSNLTFPAELAGVTTLDLSFNPLKNCVIPDSLTNMSRIIIQFAQLTNLTLPSRLGGIGELNLAGNRLASFSLPATVRGVGYLGLAQNGLTNLTFPPNLAELDNLDVADNDLTSFSLPASVTNLFFLDVSFNALTNFSLPNGLRDLDTLTVRGNGLSEVILPTGLGRLLELDLSENQLTNVVLPTDMTNLLSLNLFFNQLTNLVLPAELKNLGGLDLDFNRLTNLSLPPSMTHLGTLHLRENQLTHLELPAGLTRLTYLDIGENLLDHLTLPTDLHGLMYLRLSSNKFTSLTLPAGMTNLLGIYLRYGALTNLTLPSDLFHLQSLDVLANQLTRLDLPPNLTNLLSLFLSGNQLTELTLPPDMGGLLSLVLNGNPITRVILPEPLAATSLSGDIAELRDLGVLIFTYPLEVKLANAPQSGVGEFEFFVNGPPGNYILSGSVDLTDWSDLGVVTNQIGNAGFVDVGADFHSYRFYRAGRLPPPANMVFIPPNTFRMGSPIGEPDHQPNESPQTIVTLSRGYWIGKYEVTQGEYLDVTGNNPSQFPGDLTRPVSSVTWNDATNYCWLLTQRELAAGRIPRGSHFRLPTEAEWECAARAGTTTRFSYGDDPDYLRLTDYAWYSVNTGLSVHPVGQKLPNPWGLYDMSGNVWEWVQDWLGPLPGGAVIDPKGPSFNAIGDRVIRGGAFDYGSLDGRPANRYFRGYVIPDWDLGFRVVLVTEPQ